MKEYLVLKNVPELILCVKSHITDEFPNWSSGNQIIDNFIQGIQLSATEWEHYLEWIPYEKLVDVHYLTKGGFGKVYSAVWPEGPKVRDEYNVEFFCREENHPVALKTISHLGPTVEGFFSEINNFIDSLRPPITDAMPEFLLKLIQQCWDANPENRPDSSYIGAKLAFGKPERLDLIIKPENSDQQTKISLRSHEKAIYTSRFMNFKNLPEPTNAIIYDTQQLSLSISDIKEII
nr:3695_t:CDS:2 [Entrophospora candida]